ncbi:hypothetical protein [Lederbergia graminis]|uniref:Uncharacterized protein n=1 Tax=Lederbergia graminis TaxID=735518 RepID=A0ABW0LJ98_9BACI
MYHQNRIAKVIFNMGIIVIIAGAVIGYILGSQSYETEWIIVLQWWMTGFLSGLLFIGFSELIEIQYKTAMKLGVKHPIRFENALEEQPIKNDIDTN